MAVGADYYFSSSGSDTLGNGSLAKPWQSIAKFNQLDLNPGDSVRFRAGDVFNGKMYLDAADSGTDANGQLIAPVRIGSYAGTGSATRAKIVSPVSSEAFEAVNNGGVELSDLEFVSGGMTGGTRANGIQFLTDSTASASLSKYQHIRVHNVVAQGFGYNGLRIWAHNNVGYADVQVTDSEFFGNGYSGLYVGGTLWHDLHHANVIIDRVAAHDNPGYVGDLPYTGHGILLAQTDGGAIQNSVAYDNGKVNGNANGAIWTYRSNAILIQGNLAYGNRSPGGYDGVAYDIDGGTTNSVIQYNRSYDNDGAGLLLAEFDGADPMAQNVFRYNLSVNDGGVDYGAITIFGANSTNVAKSAVFHNNTVVVDRNAVPNTRGVIWFHSAPHQDLTFVNNTFVALNGAPLISGDTNSSKSKFLNNAYWTDGGPIILEDNTYASVQKWASLSQQEYSGGVFRGVVADPQFVDDQSYRPKMSSPLIDAARSPGGVPWPAWVTSLGSRDLVGTPLYQGLGPDIGTWEVLPADFNGDGQVDTADYVVWRRAFGSTSDLRADGNLNRIVDQGDYDMWRKYYALTAYHSANLRLGQVVPEPATIGLLVAAILSALLMRARIRQQKEVVYRVASFRATSGAK